MQIEPNGDLSTPVEYDTVRGLRDANIGNQSGSFFKNTGSRSIWRPEFECWTTRTQVPGRHAPAAAEPAAEGSAENFDAVAEREPESGGGNTGGDASWGDSYKARQTQSHPHGVFPDPENNYVGELFDPVLSCDAVLQRSLATLSFTVPGVLTLRLICVFSYRCMWPI